MSIDVPATLSDTGGGAAAGCVGVVPFSETSAGGRDGSAGGSDG
ncbi:hypothetical protein [Arthrobacter sp. Rue61a]|nr:hypothetical protein [Arthrobacter sp. Rue61a]